MPSNDLEERDRQFIDDRRSWAPQTSHDGGDGAWGGDSGGPLPPAARPAAPLSEALTDALRELMLNGTAWMEEHRTTVRWAAAATVAGSLAFLLHTGHIPGWRQYASLADVPAALLRPEGRRLPVALHSVAQRGEALAVRAAHYPLLRRLLDRYRRLPPGSAARRAAQHGRLLTCHLAGPVQPTPDGLLYLRQLQGSGVHRLRLLSIVDAADQTWTAAGASAAAASADAAAGSQLQLGPAGGGGGGGGAAAPPLVLTEQPAGARAWPLEPAGAAEEQAAGPMLWGELYAREPRRGLAALLPRRQGDVAERLIARGQAVMMEPIDLEWLGASWHRIDRLYEAEQRAIAAGLGLWRVRRPTLKEWSRSLARSAWVRVRHAARTTAAAAAGGISGGAAAARAQAAAAASGVGGAVASAAAAAAGGASGAAAKASSAVVEAVGRVAPPSGAAALSKTAAQAWQQASAAARRATAAAPERLRWRSGSSTGTAPPIQPPPAPAPTSQNGGAGQKPGQQTSHLT